MKRIFYIPEPGAGGTTGGATTTADAKWQAQIAAMQEQLQKQAEENQALAAEKESLTAKLQEATKEYIAEFEYDKETYVMIGEKVVVDDELVDSEKLKDNEFVKRLIEGADVLGYEGKTVKRPSLVSAHYGAFMKKANYEAYLAAVAAAKKAEEEAIAAAEAAQRNR